MNGGSSEDGRAPGREEKMALSLGLYGKKGRFKTGQNIHTPNACM